LFPDYNTWFSHELKDHRREWACYFCSHAPFNSPTDYQNHLMDRHPQSNLVNQFSSLLEMSQRPIVKVSPADRPFCDDWEKRLRLVNTHIPLSETLIVTPSQFKHHVGAHMEQLALFAIPRGYTEDGEADSGNAAPDAGSERSSLAISVPGSTTAQDLDACHEILTTMMNSDAYQQLPQHGGLRKMLWDVSQKLLNRQYTHASDFVEDVRRSFSENLNGASANDFGTASQLCDEFESFWSATPMSAEEQWKRWRAKSIPVIAEAEPFNSAYTSVAFRMADGSLLEAKFEESACVDDLYAYVDCRKFLGPNLYLPVVSKPLDYEHGYQFNLLREGTEQSLSMPLGGVSLSEVSLTSLFDELKKNDGTLWLTVVPYSRTAEPLNDTKGKLKVILTAEAEPLAAGARETPKAPNLRLTIVAAEGLIKRGALMAFPNPFAQANIDGVDTVKTTVYERNGNPYWNESFDIKVADDGSSMIAVEIFDDKKFAEKEDHQFLGMLAFRVSDFIDMASGGTQMFTRDLETKRLHPNSNSRGTLTCNLTTDLSIPLIDRKPDYNQARPPLQPPPQHVQDIDQELPHGWERRVDGYGFSYYVDHNTKTTQWFKPVSGTYTPIQGQGAPPPANDPQPLEQTQPADPTGSGRRASAVTAEDVLQAPDDNAWGKGAPGGIRENFTPPPYSKEQELTGRVTYKPTRKSSSSSRYSLSFAAAKESDSFSETLINEKPSKRPKGGVRSLVSKAFGKVGLDRRGKAQDEGSQWRHLVGEESTHEAQKLRLIDNCFSKTKGDGSRKYLSLS
jgi:hypothetical protein